jgi:iron complex outermembrane receptor protein
MTRPPRLSAGLLLAACLTAGDRTARAQGAPDDGTPGVRAAVQFPSVATRLPGIDRSSTVRIVTRDEIEHFPGRSLPELLQWVVGVDARRRGAEGVQADVSIRGADYNGTLVLVDGVPANDPQTNHFTLDLDVPLDAIERVEVLAGAGGAVWGADAVGGVVQIVTRGAALGRARGQSESRVVHGTQSLDAGGIRAAAKIGERLSLAVDWARSESSGFRDDTEFEMDMVRVAGRVETGRGPVAATFGYGGKRFGAYGFYGTAFPDQGEATITRSATVSSSLTLGEWTLQPLVSWRTHHDDFVLDRALPAFYENLGDTRQLLARLAARRPLLGGLVVVGGEGADQTIDSTRLGDHARRRGALFAEYGRPFDSSHPDRAGFRVGARVDDTSDYGTRGTPHAGVWFAPTDALRIRASVGTAFRDPTFTELWYRDPQNVGNPALAPEKATNVEVGATITAGALTLDAVYWGRRSTDLIDFVRSSPDEPWVARNIRSANQHGVEAIATWRAVRPGLLSRVSLAAAYVFTDLAALAAGAGATEGKYVLDPLHTKWDLIVGGTLPLALAALARVSYHARPSLTDGVWLCDARLGRDLLQGQIFEIYVEGRNLGDVSYQDVPGVPLPGRTLAGGLRITW